VPLDPPLPELLLALLLHPLEPPVLEPKPPQLEPLLQVAPLEALMQELN
jgi:hypothetical protein